MPLSSYRGELPPLTTAEIQLQQPLKQDIQNLSGELGEHNFSTYKNTNFMTLTHPTAEKNIQS